MGLYKYSREIQVLFLICYFYYLLYLVDLEKMSAQQEIETLENKCSFDMTVYKSNLEECTKENEVLKTEVSFVPFSLTLN